MLGVNGFNDDRDRVANFVKECEVNYPVLLRGHDVATNDYFVTGYPTTFWIDRKGKVVKRTTGFDKSEFKKMKDELVQAMSKDN